MPEIDDLNRFPRRLEELSAVQRMALEENCPWNLLMQETPPTLRGDDQHLHDLWREAMAARNRGGTLSSDNFQMKGEARERAKAQHAWRVGDERYYADLRSGRLPADTFFTNLDIVNRVCARAEEHASQVLALNNDSNAVLQDRLAHAHMKASKFHAFAPGAAAGHLPSGAASRSGGDSVASPYRGRPSSQDPNSSRRSSSRGRR